MANTLNQTKLKQAEQTTNGWKSKYEAIYTKYGLKAILKQKTGVSIMPSQMPKK